MLLRMASALLVHTKGLGCSLCTSMNVVRFHQLRPSLEPGRVGSCITLFEACSAFTHVTACMLAKSPCDSLHQRLQQSRCLHCCSDCYRVERTSSRAGYSRCGPPPFTAHPGKSRYRTCAFSPAALLLSWAENQGLGGNLGDVFVQVIQELLKGHEFTDTAEEKAALRHEAQFYSEMQSC